MSASTVDPAQPAVKSKRLVPLRKYLKDKLGTSRTTGWRLQREDPRFPRIAKLRGINMIEETEGDAYIEALLADRDGE